MSDSIKFGPEWLRNMSNDTSGLSTSSATTSGTGGGGGNFPFSNNRMYFSQINLFFFLSFSFRSSFHFKLNDCYLNNPHDLFSFLHIETRYPLAEYRYGREEMLSLYDKNFKLPELLPKFNKLFLEKMQSPLALIPPTADEETVIIRILLGISQNQ